MITRGQAKKMLFDVCVREDDLVIDTEDRLAFYLTSDDGGDECACSFHIPEQKWVAYSRNGAMLLSCDTLDELCDGVKMLRQPE